MTGTTWNRNRWKK